MLKDLRELEDFVDGRVIEFSSQPTVNPGNTEPSSSVFTHKSQIPVSKWGLKFSGSREGMSVSAFIERIEEVRAARNVSYEELFTSGVDIFEGDALIWFRAVRKDVNTWEQLVDKLRAEFLPFDYEYEFWNEIRARAQEDEESIVMYFACMSNLFSRLPNPATEGEKLNILKRNVAPYFIHGLGLIKISSVNELLECLAVVFAIDKFRGYVEGTNFTIITDHHSLKWLHNLKNPTPRLARWVLQLQQYEFNIEHRKGASHHVPDALSRGPALVDFIQVNPADRDRWYSKMVTRLEQNPNALPT